MFASESCSNCGHEDLSPLFTARAFDSDQPQLFTVARCEQCQLAMSLGVSEETLAAAYHEQYYGSADQKFTGLLERLLQTVIARRVDETLSQFQTQNIDVLDIGCGRGLLLQAFAAKGANITGIERDEFPDKPDFIHIGSIHDQELADRRYDVVIIWHVLEHLREIEKELDAISEHLNKDGVLLLAVPNFESLQSRIFGPHWFHLDLPRHLVHIDHNWLCHALQRRGFEVVNVNHADPVQNIYGFLQSAMNLLRPVRRNQFYEQLKFGRKRNASLLLWALFAVLIAPAALLEFVYSAVTRQGATISLTARKT